MSTRSPWKYPLDGFVYLVTTPSLWKSIFCSLLLILSLSLVIFIALVIWIFPLQYGAFVHSMPGWFSILLSLILTFFEFGFVVFLISCLVLTFRLKKIYRLIWTRELGSETGPLHISVVHSFLCLILFRVFLFLLTLPLNAIPILGTLLFLYLNGFYYAWSLHYPYFHAIGLSFQQGKDYVDRNEMSYRQFGTMAVLLELIPLVNLISPISNLIGSVLWTVEIERSAPSSSHPRSYLLAPNPSLLEQGNPQHYGSTPTTTTFAEKAFAPLPPPPPDYDQVVRDNAQLYPSAPPLDEKP